MVDSWLEKWQGRRGGQVRVQIVQCGSSCYEQGRMQLDQSCGSE